MTVPLVARFTQDLYHCSDCGYCVDAVWAERGLQHVCATLQSHSPQPGYSGRGFLLAARAWHEGLALDETALGERVFACATCGHCETVCPIGLRPAQIGRALRGELWARDHVPDAVRTLAEALARDGNPYGRSRATRGAWQPAPAASEGPASPDGQAKDLVLFLPGCAAALAFPDEARAALRLLQAAGCEVVTLGDADSCCGAPWHELGRDDEAAALLRALAARCNAANPRRAGAHASLDGDDVAAADGFEIVGSGLECLRAWQRNGDASALPVRAFIDWIAARYAEGRLALRPRATPLPAVRVLDSCQTRGTSLARTLRDLLRALGVAVLADTTAPEHVICCGAAGGLPVTQPASAMRMAEARLAAVETNVLVISPDPRCVAHLRAAADAAGSARHAQAPEILGPAVFLARHFETGPA